MHLSLLKSFHLQQGYDWTKTPLIKGTRPVDAQSWWQARTFLLRNPLPSSWHWLLPNNGGNFSASEEESSTCPPGMCMGHAASLPVLFPWRSCLLALSSGSSDENMAASLEMPRDSHHQLIRTRMVNPSQGPRVLLYPLSGFPSICYRMFPPGGHTASHSLVAHPLGRTKA